MLNASVVAPTTGVTVNVAANAPPLVIDTATVSGGGNPGSSNDSADDPTSIVGEVIFANGFEGN